MIGTYETIETDLLVLGGGDSGLLAAIHAHETAPDLSITLARRTPTVRIAGAPFAPPASIQTHFDDTIRTGAFLNDQELVWILANQAPDVLKELERRSDLVERLSKAEPRVLDSHRALDLLTDRNGSVCGAVLLDMQSGRFVEVNSRATLIATGREDSFDGIAIAHRANADLIDMEMLQVDVTEVPQVLGGIQFDQQTRSNVDGLFVTGEAAGGIHGAKQMDGNGLLESTVFGWIAGGLIPQLLLPLRSVSDAQVEAIATAVLTPLSRTAGASLPDLKADLQRILSNGLGPVRNGPGLRSAVSELESLGQTLAQVFVQPSRRSNSDWEEYVDFCNLVMVSRLAAQSSLVREDSRGVHVRADFPARDDARFLKNVWIGSGGKIKLKPVELTRMKND